MLPLEKQNEYRQRYQRRQPGWRPSGEAFEALTHRHLGPERRVLDLGCGRGGVMELFWREVRRAIGLDPDLASLREHRAGFARVCGLGDGLPFAAGSFDLVVALWVFEHLAAPERVLAEAQQVLAPGGRLLFLTPNARHPLIVFNRFSWAWPAAQRLLVPRLYGRSEADTFRVRYRANTAAELRRLARQTGFRVVTLEAIPDPTYLAFNPLLFELSVLFERLLPAGLGVHLLGEWERV